MLCGACTGSISGVVYDDKNVPIDNAHVTVTDRQTGYSRGTYASQVGQYTVYVRYQRHAVEV
ncbi:MAG: carboxypeptidase-like regulatory domain-containing protein [Deltaproteobacteria bacterium]|nr:carboxypeptidase-like regulatory domain-containing protein [Deltaproteobacteria bacterium]